MDNLRAAGQALVISFVVVLGLMVLWNVAPQVVTVVSAAGA